MRVIYRPIPSSDPARPETALSLSGGWTWFDRVECLRRNAPPEIIPAAELPESVSRVLSSTRVSPKGLSFGKPALMGILNVTPDSFSDGGLYVDLERATQTGLEIMRQGAQILDIGGESTRPGASEVSAEEEMRRVLPVIEALKKRDPNIVISLDTRKSQVARAGAGAGIGIVNDVSGLRFDPELARIAAEADLPLILMHSIGSPETMQSLAETSYTDVLLDVYEALESAVETAIAAGVPRHRLILDPGIGFGKTQAHNLALMKRVSVFHGLGLPLLIGVSRKGFVGAIGGQPQADRRGPGSVSLGLWAVSQGVQLLRVHDIEMHAQALRLWDAMRPEQE